MGLFGNMIKNAVGDGINNAVGKAVEKAVAPAAEKVANKAASYLNTTSEVLEKNEKDLAEATETKSNPFASLEQAAQRYAAAATSAVWSEALGAFPKWDYSPIKDLDSDEADEYVLISLEVDATEDALEAYREKLSVNGFAGDWQIMRKKIDGREYAVDFSFALDDPNQIRYLIHK